MDLRENLLPIKYHQPLHVHINRHKLLNLNSFVISEHFSYAGLVPLWEGRKGFRVLGTSPELAFRGAHIRNTDGRAVQHVLRNKAIFKQLLEKQQIATAKGLTFFAETLSHAQDFLLNTASQCVVKPVAGKQGKGVSTGISDITALNLAVEEALAVATGKAELLIEEQFCDAEEARFLVVNGRCIGAFKRLAPAICGDGVTTINELIDECNKLKRQNPNECRLLIELTPSRLRALAKRNYTAQSILPKGEWLKLDDKASISTGGFTYECSDKIAESYKSIAERAAMLAAPIAVIGVDIMAKDFKQPASKDNYIVLEANSGPAITGHQYPSYGKAVNIVNPIVDFCFSKHQFNPLTDNKLKVNVNIYVSPGLDATPMWLQLVKLVISTTCLVSEIKPPNHLTVSTTEKNLQLIQTRFYELFSQKQAALVFSRKEPS